MKIYLVNGKELRERLPPHRYPCMSVLAGMMGGQRALEIQSSAPVGKKHGEHGLIDRFAFKKRSRIYRPLVQLEKGHPWVVASAFESNLWRFHEWRQEVEVSSARK